MKIVITKKIGDTTLQFQIEEPKTTDALFSAGGVSSIPTQCVCGSTDVQLTGNKAKEFTYVKVKCLKCFKTSTMGEYKDGSGIFWKEFEAYNKDGLDSARDAVRNIKGEDEPNIDDIPF